MHPGTQAPMHPAMHPMMHVMMHPKSPRLFLLVGPSFRAPQLPNTHNHKSKKS